MAGAKKSQTLEAAKALESFESPVLLVWAPEDKVFPLKYAERLANAMPDARIVEVPGAGTFVALDQPERVADAVRDFVRGPADPFRCLKRPRSNPRGRGQSANRGFFVRPSLRYV